MKGIVPMMILVCVTLNCVAQTNFVKNPGLEEYSKCPEFINRINYCKHWSIPGDSTTILEYCLEYYNVCGNGYPELSAHIPYNSFFNAYPHNGDGMAGSSIYYDKTFPPPAGFPFMPFNYRDYLVGRLHKNLSAGKIYCVSFWVNLSFVSGYGINKIGAYLDDGAIHSMPDTFGHEITTVRPQVYTNTILSDTSVWVKIEGSFKAIGNEKNISIGSFFPNDSISKIVTDYYHLLTQYSYYLIDDVSVVDIDAKANAGVDRWVEQGKKIEIGPIEDSTARGMDCKWYHKGKLIDSGNVISVNASSIKYAVDTYVVVQNVCGNITRDTMLLRTVGLGISEISFENTFSIYPNPSNGNFKLTSLRGTKQFEKITAKVYDLLGRDVRQEPLNFSNKEATLKLNIPAGSYILEMIVEEGNVYRERIVIE